MVFLGDTSDRQELVGRGSNKACLQVFDLLPLFVHRGSVDALLQTSSTRFHIAPTDVSPCRRMAFGPFSKNHCLTSPKVRTLRKFTIVRTIRKSAPFRVGYLRLGGPIRPISRRRSLFPSSPTLCPVPLPYGWDTTHVGSIGLTQLLMKKSMVRSGWSLYPGERLGCRHPQHAEVILPTYHFGDGLSASLAMSASRGFMMTLHLRSTLPSFPSPSPRRGWQRSEHCSQSFTPRITRQHVWVGTPGHHRARSGSLSPCSILLHEPYEVQRICVRLPPGRSTAKARGF